MGDAAPHGPQARQLALHSFNPMTKADPVLKRFVESTPPNAIVRKVSYRDNPFMSPEAEAERQWLERTDPDAYRHVWEGFPREVSDALILRGKYVAESFEVQQSWAGPYHGLDYGFARDPSAALRCYVDDETRTLYVTHEFWALGAEIDALPTSLEAAIPGISRHVVYADSARPESTSYVARNGISNARSVEKWPGSVDDGIAYLRAFSRIVIDPSCRHLLDECGSYSFKTDRLTSVPLPEPLDANNHLIDALRYALSPLIRNQPSGGYFARQECWSTASPSAHPRAARCSCSPPRHCPIVPGAPWASPTGRCLPTMATTPFRSTTTSPRWTLRARRRAWAQCSRGSPSCAMSGGRWRQARRSTRRRATLDALLPPVVELSDSLGTADLRSCGSSRRASPQVPSMIARPLCARRSTPGRSPSSRARRTPGR